LDGEDRASEDECPFLAVDVFLVRVIGEVDAEEDGPDDREGEDVGVGEGGSGIEELGGDDLGVVYEGRPKGIPLASCSCYQTIRIPTWWR
jgi:hypothetical protein